MEIEIRVKVGKYPSTGRTVAHVVAAIIEEKAQHPVITKFALTKGGKWESFKQNYEYPEGSEFEVEILEMDEGVDNGQ